MKAVFVVAAVLFISYANGAPNGDSKKHEHKCDGTEIKLTAEIEKAQSACKAKYFAGKGKPDDAEKKTKENKAEFHANMTCLSVCNYQAFGVISSDGKVVSANIAPFVKASFPASVQEALIASLTTCATEKGASVAMTADGKCDSYQPLVKCSMEATATACKWEKPDKKN